MIRHHHHGRSHRQATTPFKRARYPPAIGYYHPKSVPRQRYKSNTKNQKKKKIQKNFHVGVSVVNFCARKMKKEKCESFFEKTKKRSRSSFNGNVILEMPKKVSETKAEIKRKLGRGQSETHLKPQQPQHPQQHRWVDRDWDWIGDR